MKLEDIARAYVAAADLDDRARSEAPHLAEEAGVLRAELHALLMQALHANNVPFTDRADAARLAYQLTRYAVTR
jgi:hypothetical protein